MIARPEFIQRRPARAVPAGSDYFLRIVLDQTLPPVTRRIVVPANARLSWLHAVLQVTVGWTNSHLHAFRAGEETYSDPEFGLDHETIGNPTRDEGRVHLREVLPSVGDCMSYEYDFGDGWLHTIEVEAIRPGPNPARRRAECLAAERACPPEDCGGPAGYANLLHVLSNRRHPDHADLKRWVGRPFKPDFVDVPRINVWLNLLKWPTTSEALLRRCLMGRDGV